MQKDAMLITMKKCSAFFTSTHTAVRSLQAHTNCQEANPGSPSLTRRATTNKSLFLFPQRRALGTKHTEMPGT